MAAKMAAERNKGAMYRYISARILFKESTGRSQVIELINNIKLHLFLEIKKQLHIIKFADAIIDNK